MKFLKMLLPGLFILFNAYLVKADNYNIEILDPNTNIEDLLPEFPLGDLVKNIRGEYYSYNDSKLSTVDNKQIFFDCLLKNSTRYSINSIEGLNDKGELLVILRHKDNIDFYPIAILNPITTEFVDYCPRVSWSVNKECSAMFQYDSDESGNVFYESRTGDFFLDYLKSESIENTKCIVKVKVKDNKGRAMPKSRVVLKAEFTGDGPIHKEKILLSGRTNSRGYATIKFDLKSLYNKFYEKNVCGSMDITLTSPFLHGTLVSRSAYFSVWSHCI